MKKEVKTKTSSIPGQTLWLEKLNTIIERDIALVILIMVLGLIHSDQWYTRGFPFTWLLIGNSMKHSIILTDHFVMDLIIAIIFVAAGEVVTAAIRRITEPVAFSNRGSSSPSYANIFDDTVSSGTEAKSFVKSFITVLFVSVMILVACLFTLYFMNSRPDPVPDDNGPDIIDIDGKDDTSELNFYDSPFFQEDNYLYSKCEDAIDKLGEGDVEWLSELGEGDAQGIIDITDWSDAEFTFEYKTASSISTEYGGFLRFIAETDNGDYMVGFKFGGEDMVWDEDNAVLTGIAVCPYSMWDDVDYSQPNAWTELTERVDNNTVAVGNYDFVGHNMLSW